MKDHTNTKYYLILSGIVLTCILMLVFFTSIDIQFHLTINFSLLVLLLIILSGILGHFIAYKKYYNEYAISQSYIVNKSNDGWAICNKKEDVLWCNNALWETFAIKSRRQRFNLKKLNSKLFGSEDVKLFKQILSYSQNQQRSSVEVAIKNKRNNKEWRKISVIPFKENITIWKITDITSIKQLEETRKKREQLRTNFLNNNPAAYYISTAEGKFIYANDIFYTWFGLERNKEIDISKYLSEIVPCNFKFTQGKEFLATARTHNDEQFNIYISTEIDNNLSLAYCLIIKYEENHILKNRFLDPEALKQDQEPSDNGIIIKKTFIPSPLYENAPIGIILISLDGRIMNCNNSYSRLFGIHHTAFIGQNFYNRIANDTVKKIKEQVEKLKTNQEQSIQFNAQITHGIKKNIELAFYASIGRDLRNKSTLIYLFAVDNSKHQNIAKDILQNQKMQAVGQLAGGVAHDFNNQLTAIIGSCDLLLSSTVSSDPVTHPIKQIKQNAERSAELVKKLLSFSRQSPTHREVLNLNNVLEDLKEFLKRTIDEAKNNIDISFKPDRTLKQVKCDKTNLEQMIINLVVNARDAMQSKDNGEIIIRTDNQNVAEDRSNKINTMPKGNYVTISVQDNGIGISAEVQERMFEPFFTTKKIGDGTGLGLATVFNFVIESNGYIFIESEANEGTIFSIFLPVHEITKQDLEKEQQNLELQKQIEKNLTGNEKILFIDDEISIRQIYCKALANRGYHVKDAENGFEALKIISEDKFTPQLVITDISMPVMGGFEFVNKALEKYPNLNIIIMSGYSEDHIPETLLQAKNIQFLEKPYSIKKLETLVRQTLGIKT